MGLFSTRKSDDNLERHAIATNDSNTVVRVLRSRFYGKTKGKERVSPIMSYIPSDTSPSQTLSAPSPHSYFPSSPSPLSRPRKSMQNNAAAGPSSPRILHRDELVITPPRNAKRQHQALPDTPPPPPPKSPTIEHRQRDREKDKDGTPTKSPTVPPSPRKATDLVTATLAQKLNDLGVANSEGLLNDEEYRLLRQNLFERFSSTAAVPAEAPVVPVSKPKLLTNDSSSSPSRPLPNGIQAEIPQSPSKTSLSSGVAGIFRRATGRRSSSATKDTSDTSSFVSEKSGSSKVSRILPRKSSISSMSQAQADSSSVTSRRTNVGSDRLHSESVTSLSAAGTRSVTGSIRRFNTPPSSFRGVRLDNKSIYSGVYDDDRLRTSQEIKQEILAVEAEARSLMDAFNGLELTALTKLQKKTGRNSVIGLGQEGSDLEAAWTIVSEGPSQRMAVDNDSMSIKSGTSAASMARSAYSARQVRTKKSLGSPGMLLHRQNSSSSFGSSKASNSLLGHGHGGSKSNLSLTRNGNQPIMRVVREDGEGGGKVREEEMEEIRRKREDVMMRYEARLEYLRARLKGAQLHEKLLKK